MEFDVFTMGFRNRLLCSLVTLSCIKIAATVKRKSRCCLKVNQNYQLRTFQLNTCKCNSHLSASTADK